MPIIEFRTASPLQTVQRALDELARAGFRLAELCIQTPRDEAEVRLTFDGTGSVPPRTYALRVCGIPGIQPVSLPEEPTP